MKTELIKYDNPDTIAVLKSTVASELSNAEFILFSELCKSTGLNPFKKEIWAIKAGGKLQLMTGINGFYTIANNNPQFDGIETEIIEEGGKIVKAVARVHRKDRKIPMTAEAYWVEYNKSHGNWKTMPRVMLSKCAESMALRKAFPQELNGLYTAEEMPAEFSQPQVSVSTVENVQVKVSHAPALDSSAKILKAEPVKSEETKPSFLNSDYWNVQLTFGKHSGKTLQEIYDEDAWYLETYLAGKWMQEAEDRTSKYYKADYPLRDAIQSCLEELNSGSIVDSDSGYEKQQEQKAQLQNIDLDSDEIPW